jgi:pimeloyl-ACP methyl ester carboxylesterase
VDDLERDYRVVNVDLRGHGDSAKPHEPSAYRLEAVVGDVVAVADAEGIDRFALWGLSYGGWIAWMTAQAIPERVPALISSGAWDPRPETDEAWKEWDDGWGAALRERGTEGLVELIKAGAGDACETEYPPWAEATTLRCDPQALLAINAPELRAEGLSGLESFPVPVLLISGELEDEAGQAAVIASMVPRGQSLRLPGLGHGGACAASALALPTARGFLERWYA